VLTSHIILVAGDGGNGGASGAGGNGGIPGILDMRGGKGANNGGGNGGVGGTINVGASGTASGGNINMAGANGVDGGIIILSDSYNSIAPSGGGEVLIPTVTGSFGVVTADAAPTTSSDPGVAGEIRIDGSYVFICVADSTWIRCAIVGGW